MTLFLAKFILLCVLTSLNAGLWAYVETRLNGRRLSAREWWSPAAYGASSMAMVGWLFS